MSEKKVETVSMKEDPKELEILIKMQKEQVAKLGIQEQNLITQIIQLKKQKEGESKQDDYKLAQERNKNREEFAELKNSLNSEREKIANQETMLANRIRNVEKREAEVRDAKFWLEKLRGERVALYNLRKDANKMMDEAKEKFNHVDGKLQDLKAREDDLKNKDIYYAEKDKWWNDLEGEILERKKKLDNDVANYEALMGQIEKPKEVKETPVKAESKPEVVNV